VINAWLRGGLVLVLGCLLPMTRSWAIDPRFVLDPAEIGRPATAPANSGVVTSPVGEMKSTRYTVKPGDSIRKILMGEYGLSESQTDAMVPLVQKANDIKDIRRLRVGSTLVIPNPEKNRRESRRQTAKGKVAKSRIQVADGHQLRLLHGDAAVTDSVTPLRDVWPRLVPQVPASQGTTIDLADDRYTLAFDPARYPMLSATDGGKILLDTAGTLPLLVRSLISEKYQSIRIVSEDPANRRRFLAAVLGSARFYSVEENFSFEVGTDPRLKVFSDFKIERTAESLLQRDVTLLNLTEQRRPLPPVLVGFLNGEGFKVLEPFADEVPKPTTELRGTVYQVTDRGAMPATDTLLRVLNMPVSRDRTVELYSLAKDGVKLEVKADRLFEERGQQYVVNVFDGNPVSYTLSRLLETRGYKVIMLDARDDFPKVSERIMGRLRLGGGFGMQSLRLPPDAPYAIHLSGIEVGKRGAKEKQVILTTSPLSPFIRELAQFSGFEIVE
jgi:hypothetical protein